MASVKKPAIAHVESELSNNIHLESYSSDDIVFHYQKGDNIHIPPGKPPGPDNPPINPPEKPSGPRNPSIDPF
ncbi:hypothetical protein [Nitrosomonas communis]|uniref:Uncharacterized protein n=1 Tax=Nitrosomonas communis TaxID=44574 RepID=A0A1H2ZFI7_9PROT|nr:hypothetical protein [Nitrosomonas communis]SDX16253.1 hypothetical protein SAMN05421882_10751 [Nitrosomonas communis]